MKDISALVGKVKSNKKDYERFDKSNIKQAVVSYAIELLGWDVHDPSEVSFDYVVGSKKAGKRGVAGGAETVDYALSKDNVPVMFIQVEKGALDRFEKPLIEQAQRRSIALTILTNGIEWRFYLSTYPKWKESIFATVDLSGDAKKASEEMSRFLAKENVDSGKAFDDAKRTHSIKATDAEIQDAVDRWKSLAEQDDKKDKLLSAMVAGLLEKLTGKKPDAETLKKMFEVEKPVEPETTVQQ